MEQPGMVAFIGSGETAALGGQVYDLLSRGVAPPLRVAVLETPAGFELNATQVAGRVAEFIARRLQNTLPEISVIAARRKGSSFSPDNEAVVEPIFQAGLIFLGPGSPTYAVRQLSESLAWEALRSRHRLGAAVAFASAATIAAGRSVLPVYEIYKAGHDPYWMPGLDFLAPFGLHLTFIPHWNNSDGGAELDTSRCFIGQERFDALRLGLPPAEVVVGIDEHTALVLDLAQGEAHVLGRGSVHILKSENEHAYPHKTSFNIRELGAFTVPPAGMGIRRQVYQRALQAGGEAGQEQPGPPLEVEALSAARETARREKNWAEADRLRRELSELGWGIKDTPDGALLERLK